MKKLLMLLSLGVLGFALTGCQTTEEDVVEEQQDVVEVQEEVVEEQEEVVEAEEEVVEEAAEEEAAQ